MEEQKQHVEGIREAFKAKFERFANFRSSASDLKLATAVTLSRELAEFKTKHIGKKSEIAEAKKLIGKVEPEERGRFGQLVQSVEREIVEAIEDVEAKLNGYIQQAETERDRLDVTIPGRRPRTGHLHPITILRQRSKTFSCRWAMRSKTTARSRQTITTLKP